jgi:hypothetical protein
MCCPGCYFCDIMKYSAVLLRKRIVLVFRDIIYVINILYLWHLLFVNTLCPCMWNK